MVVVLSIGDLERKVPRVSPMALQWELRIALIGSGVSNEYSVGRYMFFEVERFPQSDLPFKEVCP